MSEFQELLDKWVSNPAARDDFKKAYANSHAKLVAENERLRVSLRECLALVRLQNGNLHREINEIQVKAIDALAEGGSDER